MNSHPYLSLGRTETVKLKHVKECKPHIHQQERTLFCAAVKADIFIFSSECTEVGPRPIGGWLENGSKVTKCTESGSCPKMIKIKYTTGV